MASRREKKMTCRSLRTNVAIVGALCILLPSISCESEKWSVRTRNSIVRRDMRKIFATSAYTVSFVEHLKMPDHVNVDKLLLAFKDLLNNLSGNQSGKFVNSTIHLMVDTNKRFTTHFHLMNQHASHRQGNGTSRRRREVSMRGAPMSGLSTLFGWCCGFSNYEDVALLAANDDQLLEYISKVKEQVVDMQEMMQHNVKAEKEFEKQLQKRDEAISTTINSLREKQESDVDKMVMVALLISTIMTMTTNKILTAQNLTSIHSACAERKIPEAAISLDYLKEAIDKVEKKIETKADVIVRDYTLYRLRIATCILRNDVLFVLVKLPLRDKKYGKWTGFDLAPIPFAYEKQVCRLLPHPVAVLYSNQGHIRVMSPEERVACLASDVCQVPRSTQNADPIGVSKDCLQSIIHDEGNANEGECTYTCTNYTNVQVTHIVNNSYSVVNINRMLKVRCDNAALDMMLHPQPRGALEVNLPCDCTLMDGRTTLIAKVVTCDTSQASNPEVSVQVPSLWAWSDESQKLIEQYASQKFNETGARIFVQKLTAEPFKARLLYAPSAESQSLLDNAKPRLAFSDFRSATGNSFWSFPMLPDWILLVWVLGLTIFMFILCRRQNRQIQQSPVIFASPK